MRRRRFFRRVAWWMATLVLLIPGAPAFAQYPGGGETPPDVAGERFFRGGTARTGTDLLLFLVIALMLIVLGSVAYYASKRGARREG